MPKTTDAERILRICNDLAKLVHKERSSKTSEHYENLLTKLQEQGCVDIGLDLLEDVAAIVSIGLESKGQLSDEVLDQLEEKLNSLLRLIGTAKRNT